MNLFHTILMDLTIFFQDEQEAKKPGEGTISRGFTPYEYDDNTEGYTLAKSESKK